MTRDLEPDAAAVRRAVEEFGSVAHLAHAISVSVEDVRAWLAGTVVIPAGKYQAMLDALAARRKP